jgi:membrane fusion protein (multidrug efflux system)
MSSCGNDKKQGPPPKQKIPVVKVVKRDVPIYTEYVGQIYGQKDIPIRARVEGFL